LKLNSDGTVAWQKTYGGVGNDEAYAVQQTADNGYVVAGMTDSYGAGSGDAWLLKLNSDGTVAWQKTYGGVGNDEAYAVQQTADNGYIVAGVTDSFGAGYRDVWTFKLDSDGTVAWEKSYGSTGDDEARAVRQTVDGGYIVAGESNDDIWAFKLNSDGTIIEWQKTYGDTGYEEAYAVQQTADGGYLIAGSTSSFSSYGYDVFVIKLGADGSDAWQKTWGGAGYDDHGRAMQETPDGEYVVAGGSESWGDFTNHLSDVCVVRLNKDGEIADCSPIRTRNTAVSDTFVVPEDSNSQILDTSVVPLDSSASAQDTSSNVSDVCSESAVPAAAFSATPRDGMIPLSVQFTDKSQGLITSYWWSFGDGYHSAEPNPSHVYKTIREHFVELTVAGPYGSDTKRRKKYINGTEGLPVPDFQANTTIGNPPFTIRFTDKSSDRFGRIDKVYWDFGDTGTGWSWPGGSITHYYTTEADAFTISVRAVGPVGSDTKTKIDYIHRPDYIPSHPVIDRIKPKRLYAGEIINIYGHNFGVTQGDSVVRINGKVYGPGHKKIKLWTDTRIKIALRNYPCEWFQGENVRTRKVWVIVGGGQSNIKKITVKKPTICP